MRRQETVNVGIAILSVTNMRRSHLVKDWIEVRKWLFWWAGGKTLQTRDQPKQSPQTSMCPDHWRNTQDTNVHWRRKQQQIKLEKKEGPESIWPCRPLTRRQLYTLIGEVISTFWGDTWERCFQNIMSAGLLTINGEKWWRKGMK